jgi:DNA polymerase-1
MKANDGKLVLIDASAVLYRAFYGLKPLTTSSGMKVQAVYGFCRALRQLLDAYSPCCIAVVWDKGDSGRKSIFEGYKSSRQAAPVDLVEQRRLIHAICDAIKIPQLSVQGFEADDVIYSAVMQNTDRFETTVVVSPDKDLRQMVSSSCVVFDPIYKKTYNEAEFFKKYEFKPEQLSSYFGFVGDSADDIAGVAGVGDVGATSLIKQFGSLENVYENLDKITSASLKKKLIEGRESAFLGKKLFTLQMVDGFACDPHSLAYDPKNWELAYPFFRDLEFKSLIPAHVSVPKAEQAAVIDNWVVTIIETMGHFLQLSKQWGAAERLVIDTETTGLSNTQAELIGISIASDKNTGFYISFIHDHWNMLEIEQIKAVLGAVLSQHPCVVMHNAKFDLHILATANIALPVHVQDTMLMADLLKTDDETKVGLKSLSLRLLNEPMDDFKTVTAGFKSFSDVPLEDAAKYATHDVVQTYKLYDLFEKSFAGQLDLKKVYDDIELPMNKILYGMERTGILVDTVKLKQTRHDVAQAMEVVDAKIKGFLESVCYPGLDTFNVQSPKQVGEVLYDYLKLKSTQKTSGGARSTNREVLDELAKVHPLPALILEYRELAKLINTYLDPLPLLVDPQTGRVHTTYSQVGAATGRLASSDPNLQNIPVSSDFGMAIRHGFVAPHGKMLLSADYSQVELRVLAHLSGDPVLTNAFIHNEDPHRQIAARLFAKLEEDVTTAERQIGKKINFSIIYGLTPYGLSQDLGISLKAAKEYVEQYFLHYPGIKPWMEKVEHDAKRDGYVTTLMGRRRYVPGLQESNKNVYEAARRVAVNTVVQGTAADIIKLAMIHVADAIRLQNLPLKLLLQIHDELLFECLEGDVEAMKGFVVEQMEHAIDLAVPLKISVGVGKSWGDV